MDSERNNNETNIQDLILKGFKLPTKQAIKHDEQSCEPRISTKYAKLYHEEASMNQYMLQLKCLLKNLTMLEEGMVYIGNTKPIEFEPIYVLAQMQAKLYKFRNRLGHLPKEHRKYAHNLIGKAYDTIIDQCVKGAQNENCLKKIVTEVAYINDIIMKYSEKNNQNCMIPYGMNICPWRSKNNIPHTTKLPLKTIDQNVCKFKFINNKNVPKCKKKNCTRKSGFLEKVKEVTKQEGKERCKTAHKRVSVSIKTDSVAMQFDPKLSGPMPVPEGFSEDENKIRSSWLANIKQCSCRDSIEEKIPPENICHYDVPMRHASTNVLSSNNTKETQTIIPDVPLGDYEYTVMDMKYTKERIVKEKTKEEMIKDLRNRKVFLLSETDIFETMSQDKQEDSDSSSGIVVEDSDCNIKISNVQFKPCYKKYKMLYTANKNLSSNNNTSVLINQDTIEHKDEILAYIKELGSILVNSYKDKDGESEDSGTDGYITTN